MLCLSSSSSSNRSEISGGTAGRGYEMNANEKAILQDCINIEALIAKVAEGIHAAATELSRASVCAKPHATTISIFGDSSRALVGVKMRMAATKVHEAANELLSRPYYNENCPAKRLEKIILHVTQNLGQSCGLAQVLQDIAKNLDDAAAAAAFLRAAEELAVAEESLVNSLSTAQSIAHARATTEESERSHAS